MNRLAVGLLVLAAMIASALYWNLFCETQALAACTQQSSERVNNAVGGAVTAIHPRN